VPIGEPASAQGDETVIAQIVAYELSLVPEAVSVARGFDSSVSPWLYLSGNYSNKFSVTDVGAIVGAARIVADKLRRLPGPRLEIAPADLDLRDGAVVVRGAPDRRVAFVELC